jgi:hypothetical protein
MRGMVEQWNVAICNDGAPKPAWEAGPAPMGRLGEMVGFGIIGTTKSVFV